VRAEGAKSSGEEDWASSTYSCFASKCGRISTGAGTALSCQLRTHASQQIAPLFDHLVGAGVALLYFVGALADAPASAGLDMSDPTDRIASVAAIVIRLLYIASSSWFEAIDPNGFFAISVLAHLAKEVRSPAVRRREPRTHFHRYWRALFRC
jgi:hypothetical protein